VCCHFFSAQVPPCSSFPVHGQMRGDSLPKS
jgi:hypothetical protein